MGQTRRRYLKICQAVQVWIQVVVDPFPSSREGETPDEQYQKHHIGERGCEVHYLGKKVEVIIIILQFLEVMEMTNERLPKNKMHHDGF